MRFLKKIYQSVTRQKTSILLVYIIQLLLAAIVGYTIYGCMDHAIGHSTSLNLLAKGFDRTVLTDMVRVHWQEFSTTRMAILSVLGLYFFVGVFLNAGLFISLVKDHRSVKEFFGSAMKNFFPFLVFAVFFLILFAIGLLAMYGIFVFAVGNPLETFYSEKGYVWAIAGMVGLSFWYAIFLWTWSLATKITYLEQKKIWPSIKNGYLLFSKNKKLLFVWGWSLFVVYAVMTIGYFYINRDMGAQSIGVVIIYILLQQTQALIRVVLKAISMKGVIEIIGTK